MFKILSSFVFVAILIQPFGLSAQNKWDSTGNIGIGTKSPVVKLSIYGPADSDAAISLQSATNSRFYISQGGNLLKIGGLGHTGPGVLNITNGADGLVGIGTTVPGAKLDVAGTINSVNGFMTYSDIGTGGLLIANNTTKKLRWIIRGTNVEGGSNTGYDLDFVRRGDDGNATGSVLFMRRSDGNVGIGTNSPGVYKLAVNGTIGARKIKVTQETWADFVFDHDYALPSLQELETYIKANHRLPEMPSTAQVQVEGLDLGEMDRRLLQKVEELTLYLLEMNKTNMELKQRVSELEQTVKSFHNK